MIQPIGLYQLFLRGRLPPTYNIYSLDQLGFEAFFVFIFVIYYKIFVPLHTMLAIRTDQV